METTHTEPERTTVSEHLSTALETAEDENTKYHVREAYQKLLVLTEGQPD